MPDEPELQKLKKEYPEFFKEFPAKLIELIESEETMSQIAEVCLKNGLEKEELIEGVAYHITSVLLSRLPSEILPKALATNLKINADVAEKISLEANRLIFAPVKDDLVKLHEGGVEPEKTIPPKKEKPTEEPPKPPGKDVYHEPLE